MKDNQCAHWDILHKRCIPLHKSELNPHFCYVRFSKDDFDKNCNGKSNCNKCTNYKPVGYNSSYERKRVRDNCSLRW